LLVAPPFLFSDPAEILFQPVPCRAELVDPDAVPQSVRLELKKRRRDFVFGEKKRGEIRAGKCRFRAIAARTFSGSVV
jgi:hypothetical protein